MARMKEYIPKHLRKESKPKRITVMYAIGTEHEELEFGMWYGPISSEEDALEQEGKTDNDYIFIFNLDGTDEAIWKWVSDRWISSWGP